MIQLSDNRNYLTVTVNFLETPLHVTVMVALPFLIPFTTPLEFTVATFVLLDLYLIVFEGVALALIVVVFFTLIDAEDFVRVRVGFLTVTVQVVFAEPHVTVIVVFPAAFGVILPVVLFTVRTFVLLDLNVGALEEPFTVAFRVVETPLYAVSLEEETVTTGFTVTLQVSVKEPHVTVIVVVPSAFAVILPVVLRFYYLENRNNRHNIYKQWMFFCYLLSMKDLES